MPDLDQIEYVINWFENHSTEATSGQDLLLRAAKKLSDVAPEIRQLGFHTFVGRKQVHKYEPILGKGFFTKAGLEQRTHPLIASYRASKFSKDDTVLEVGSGLGFDTAALSKNVKHVFSIEKDPIHAAFAEYNLSLQGIKNVTIICADFSEIADYSEVVASCTALFADPARRTKDGERVKKGAEYSPSMDELLKFSEKFRTVAIKVSPVYKEMHDDFRNEWIGFEKECKERILWMKSAQLTNDSVSIIDSDATENYSIPLEDRDIKFVESTEKLVGGYVLFPHPALLASDRAEQFAGDKGFLNFPSSTRLFFTEAEPTKSLFYDCFHIFRVMPFDEKKLVSVVSDLGWNANTELKKKNFPIEPESFRGRLKLPPHSKENTDFGTIIFTQFEKQQIILLAKRI